KGPGRGPNAIRAIKAPRVHIAAWRRGGGMANCGARAGGHAARRHDLGHCRRGWHAGAPRGISAGAAAIRLGRGSQCAVRISLGNGDTETLRKDAAELAALAPDVIVATGGATTTYMLQATHTVPIVFVIVPDPVGSGFVKSLSRPGGNATGF